MKILFLSLTVCITFNTIAQSYEQEINDQVWKPFTQSLLNRDAEGFIAVHSKDVIRVERNETVNEFWDMLNTKKAW